jgi:hypothetical protein
MNEKSTQQELDAQCKALSRKWHPDRQKVYLVILILTNPILMIVTIIKLCLKRIPR